MTKRLSQIILLAAASFGGCYASTFGDPALLTGTLTETAGQIVTVGDYASDSQNFTFSWIVTPDGPLYDYTYTLSGYTAPGISHFIISLTPGCSADPNCITDANGTISYDLYPGQGNSNPNFPAGETIDGVKFEFGSETTTTYSFTSDRSPVYGNFYLKGGNGPAAYNAGLADPTTGWFIARPDGSGPASVPEPGTWMLLGSGGILIALGRRKLSR